MFTNLQGNNQYGPNLFRFKKTEKYNSEVVPTVLNLKKKKFSKQIFNSCKKVDVTSLKENVDFENRNKVHKNIRTPVITDSHSVKGQTTFKSGFTFERDNKANDSEILKNTRNWPNTIKNRTKHNNSNFKAQIKRKKVDSKTPITYRNKKADLKKSMSKILM